MDKEELISKLEVVKSEIVEIRKKIGELRQEKDAVFKRRENLRDSIKKKISDLRTLKNKKDKDSIGLQEERKEKSILNQELTELIKKVKQLNEERKEIVKERKVPTYPDNIKKLIQKLEEKIETEVVSYEEEKRLMKKIRKLKEEYKSLKGIIDINAEYKKISGNIDTKKNRLDEIRKKIREDLEKSSDYDDFMKISKEIFELKNQVSQLNEEYYNLKTEVLKAGLQLKEKIIAIEKIRKDLDSIDKENKRANESKKQELLIQRVSVVEEKLKKGQKLSTEDLIAFQANKP
ncbi:hypothetical protein J4471_01110 [Candidatus Woesearchaeota archaeon]|nr:hypothetical protein [Candidatus Woesearchaeota archaeon]